MTIHPQGTDAPDMDDLATATDEKRQLQQILARLENAPQPLSDQAAQVQQEAQSIMSQLDDPVRIAVAGTTGSGKSSLVNLLLGSRVMPVNGSLMDIPTVLLKYAPVEQTTAGWWDRPGVTIPGIEIGEALVHQPDIITLELNCEALEQIWLVDVAPLDHARYGRAALYALANLADTLIWCSDISESGASDPSAYLKKLPAKLRRDTIYACSHADLVDTDEIPGILRASGLDAAGQSSAILPISTTSAFAALTGEASDADQAWDQSGADDLINAVLTASARIRTLRLNRAQRLIDAHGQVLSEHRDPVADLPDEPDTPDKPNEPATGPASADLSSADDILTRWLGEVAGLLDAPESTDDDFAAAAQELLVDFGEYLSSRQSDRPEITGLVREFERAENLIVLFRYEQTDSMALDIARVLLQLSDALAVLGELHD